MGIFRTISIYYKTANFTAIITHNTRGYLLHYNINVWHAFSMINETVGICKSDTCESEHHEVQQQKSNNYQKVTLEMACTVCEIYLKNYLAMISQISGHRDVHYNKTINNVREACVFDIQTTGVLEAAASGMEVLMVEKLTNETKDLKSIQINFEENWIIAVDKLSEAIIQSEIEIKELLDQSTTITDVMTPMNNSSGTALNTGVFSITDTATNTSVTSCVTSVTSTFSPNLSTVTSKAINKVSHLFSAMFPVGVCFMRTRFGPCFCNRQKATG
ncbi:unnamed protein product [Adineta ricciae]|uniref:Uncharacterized protein n=1 Tax=Adineta ricciae TaxID=249248 RepID=A0A814WPU5_ADIRI|nr:unnamed protein product [Adineta ricciae]CAF1308070.1 unnamed protein product [Adineta ricciae]